MTLRLPRLSLSILALLLSLTLLPNTSFATNTQEQMDIFTQRTERVLKEAEQLADVHLKLVERITDILESGQKPSTIFSSGLLAEMATAIDRSLVNIQTYRDHFEVFLNSIDKESPCYNEQAISDIDKLIAEKKQVAQTIREVSGAQVSDTEAIVGLLVIVVQDLQTAMLPGAFELLKLCLLPDAMGITRSQIERMEAQKAKEQAAESTPEKTFEQYTESFEITPEDTLSINSYLPVYIETAEQLTQLTLSHGVTVNEDFELQLPKHIASDTTQTFEFTITGKLTEQDVEYNINTSIKRIGFTPLSTLKFTNPQIQTCVDTIAQYLDTPYIEKFTGFQCQLTDKSMVSAKELAQLVNIDSLSLSGGRIEDFAEFSKLTNLKYFNFDSVAISSFGKSNFEQITLLLVKPSVDDWRSLSSVTSGFIVAENFQCDLINELKKESNTFIHYRGMDEMAYLTLMQKAGEVENSKLITVDCPVQ